MVFEGDVEEAIEVYMGTFGDTETHYEYTREHHSNSRSTENFVIQALDIKDYEEALFSSGDVILLSLRCTATKKWEGVKFRFEIQYQDGTVAGTMLTDTAIEVCEGENILNLKFDTEHLTPGRYKVDIIAYLYDTYGNEQYLDGVYPGMIFEIDDTVSERNQLVWLHKYWGHIRLHDVEKEN